MKTYYQNFVCHKDWQSIFKESYKAFPNVSTPGKACTHFSTNIYTCASA